MTAGAQNAKADQAPALAGVNGHQGLHDLKLALNSCYHFIALVAHGSLHQRRDRLGETFGIERGGRYSIFLDTNSRDGIAAPSAVLVVGFRLRWINSNGLLHRIFRRICIISTPIWSGFPGYRVKLWMVDYGTQDYLGIYEWAGEENALVYVEWLTRLLRSLSAKSSVWYEIYPNEKIGSYLEKHRASGPQNQRQALHPLVGE
ncbi:MAG TPA: hypothetical protein VFF30_14475 [Nitrososphaerales archaeon]|nr:hypothetical protein [Nitrososphaerales archaeon]